MQCYAEPENTRACPLGKEGIYTNKKKKLQTFLLAALTIFLLGLVYRMFRGSWAEITAAIRQANPLLLGLIILMGIGWYCIDAIGYWVLYRREGMPLHYWDCVRIAFMSIFCDVSTMGTATKPLQLWFSYQKGADVGRCASILVIPYIFQKAAITVLALVLFALEHRFINLRFDSTVHYVYLGAAGSILVSAALVAVCAAPGLHASLLKLIERVFRGPRWDKLRKTAREQLAFVAQASRDILTDKKTCALLALNSCIKLLLLYSIPAVSLYAVQGNLEGASISELFAMTAIMKLIMGVIPTAGGVGSLEMVFSLLFATVFGEVMGGTLMVLFRLATYYLPFIVSLFLVGGLFRDYQKQDGRTPS